MSFRLKTILGVGLIEAFLLTILIVSGLYYLTSSNQQQLLDRAQTTAKLVATMTADSVIAVDLATLDALVEQAIRNPDLVYLRIRANSGISMSEGGEPNALTQEFVADAGITDARRDGRLDIAYPITVAGSEFGQVEIGVSIEGLDATRNDALKWMAGIAVTELLLVGLLGFGLGQYLTRQLDALRHGAHRVAAGAFGHQINVSGSDELAETAASFNQMSAALQRYSEEAETARRVAEEGRVRAESVLHDALNSLPEAVAIIDDDERVVLLNPVMRRNYDLDDREIEDANGLFFDQVSKIGNADPMGFVDERLQSLRRIETQQREPVQLVDGRQLLISQHGLSGGGAVLIEVDVTELTDAHEENRRLQLEIIRQHKTEALGTLGAGIAHEINTPIQAISTNLGFIADSVQEISAVIDLIEPGQSARLDDAVEGLDWVHLKDDIPDSIGDMTDAAKRVQEIVETFREISRHDSEGFKETDLQTLLADTIDVTHHRWSGVAEVNLDVRGDVPPVRCDPAEIGQVVMSLIGNAADALDGVGRAGTIAIILEKAGRDQARFIIADNGSGITDADLHRIFDPMFTTKQPGRGTGGGLAICQTIVERRHGGRIDVESELGVGSRFSVTLPVSGEEHIVSSTNIIEEVC